MKEKASIRLAILTKSPIFRIVAAQCAATLIASGLSVFFDRVVATSALMAGVACIVPGCYTLVVSLRPVSEGDPGLRHVLRGELGKFALTVSLFALVFVFFSTFVGLQLCMAAILWWDSRKLLRR